MQVLTITYSLLYYGREVVLDLILISGSKKNTVFSCRCILPFEIFIIEIILAGFDHTLIELKDMLSYSKIG